MTSRHTPYYNLLDALAAPGCALCALSKAAIDHYLDSMLYEYVNDTPTQQTMTNAHGMCAGHSEVLLGYQGALGIAILYRAVINHLETEAAELPEAAPASGDGSALRLWRKRPSAAPLAAHAPCPACVIRDETSGRALALLDEHHADRALQAAVDAADGLCLPHFNAALAALQTPARARLLARQVAVWGDLRGQLDEFIRKNDYRFQKEGFSDAERESWTRAVRMTCGAPGVF